MTLKYKRCVCRETKEKKDKHLQTNEKKENPRDTKED